MRWLPVLLLISLASCTYRIPFGAPQQPIKHGWDFQPIFIPGHLQRTDPTDLE